MHMIKSFFGFIRYLCVQSLILCIRMLIWCVQKLQTKDAILADEELANEESETLPKSPFLVGIQFNISTNNKNMVDIALHWDNELPSTAQRYGVLLYQICNGMLAQHVRNLLLENGQSDPHTATFIRSVLTNWQVCHQRQNMDAPIIQPHQALGTGREE